GGGRVDLSGATSYTGGAMQVLTDGAGSTVDLSQLPKLFSDAGNDSTLTARNAGKIVTTQLTALDRVSVVVQDTGTVTTSGLTDIDGASLYAAAGATLALPALTGYTGVASHHSVFQAADAKSKLDLSKLATLHGGPQGAVLYINAYGGARVDLSGATSYAGGAM